MVKVLLLIAIFIMVLAACGSESKAVRMGTEGAYPPYNFINDKGEVDGFERELGDELCRRAELECTWVTNEWDTIIPNLLEGSYDLIIAGMSITDERDEIIDFTRPYIPPIPSVYLALKGAGDEAAHGKIAAQVATIHSDYLQEIGSYFVEYDLAEDLVEAVLNAEVDAALVDREFAHDNVTANQDRLAVVGPDVILDSGIGIGIRGEDDHLREELNEAIDSMKEDGSLNVLIRKWFDDDAETF